MTQTATPSTRADEAAAQALLHAHRLGVVDARGSAASTPRGQRDLDRRPLSTPSAPKPRRLSKTDIEQKGLAIRIAVDRPYVCTVVDIPRTEDGWRILQAAVGVRVLAAVEAVNRAYFHAGDRVDELYAAMATECRATKHTMAYRYAAFRCAPCVRYQFDERVETMCQALRSTGAPESMVAVHSAFLVLQDRRAWTPDLGAPQEMRKEIGRFLNGADADDYLRKAPVHESSREAVVGFSRGGGLVHDLSFFAGLWHGYGLEIRVRRGAGGVANACCGLQVHPHVRPNDRNLAAGREINDYASKAFDHGDVPCRLVAKAAPGTLLKQNNGYEAALPFARRGGAFNLQLSIWPQLGQECVQNAP